ncbi:MAG: sugar dehydrogenase complex small subunit [Methylocella sp.]
MTNFTRRNMLAGAVGATAAAATAVNLTVPASADEADDLASFVKMSSALTGIDEARLAPAVDPVQIKHEYLAVAKADRSFDRLMAVFRANQSQPPAMIADMILNQSGPDIRYLGRSIILAWYLGAWYNPATLEEYNSPRPPLQPILPVKIISPAAYTQGWAWRVAQAHPMGYSELRFGYWSKEPPSLNDFTE